MLLQLSPRLGPKAWHVRTELWTVRLVFRFYMAVKPQLMLTSPRWRCSIVLLSDFISLTISDNLFPEPQ